MASGALKLTGNGSLITVGAGAKVTLGSTGQDLVLEGKSGNTAALVTVDGGELTLENGAVITGNKSSTDGGGVYVGSGTFTMTGGEISGNESAGLGGGVYVSGSGNFSKTGGGLIYGNDGSASANTAAQGDTWGHAVYFAVSLRYYRDITLDEADDISTGYLPATVEQTYDGTNWIKKGVQTGGLFSGILGVHDSVIDEIRAVAAQTGPLVFALDTGVSTELVTPGSGDMTINETGIPGEQSPRGLVLQHGGGLTNSPAALTIDGQGRVIQLKSGEVGTLITVNSGVTLTLKNITFRGKGDHYDPNGGYPLIRVNTGGTLILEDGAMILDNYTIRGEDSSGVSVHGGSFVMRTGATVGGNSTRGAMYSAPDSGGNGIGVGVRDGGMFTMEGGEIRANRVGEYCMGGGVYVTGTNSRFIMKGGTILLNNGDNAWSGGGGVAIDGGLFVMTGGTIIENGARKGDGVYVQSPGRFVKLATGTSQTVNGTTYMASNPAGTIEGYNGHNYTFPVEGWAVWANGSTVKTWDHVAGPGVALDSRNTSGWDDPVELLGENDPKSAH
jgi:hypothetical protein